MRGLGIFDQHLSNRTACFNSQTDLLNPLFLLVQAGDESLGCSTLLSHGRFEILSLLRHG